MIAMLMGIIPTCLDLCVSYDWPATALKPPLECNAVSFGHFSGFSHNNCMYTECGMYSQATPGLINAYITGFEEFARN